MLREDGDVVEVELDAPTSMLISGKVRDADGLPVIDAWVRALRVHPPAISSDGLSAAVLTDSEGAFVIEGLLPGRYDLHASTGWGEADISAIEAGARGSQLLLRRNGMISGTVENESGKFVPEFTVSLRGANDRITSVTGANGRWSIPTLQPGAYHLTAVSSFGVAEREVAFESGASLNLALVVSRDKNTRSPDRLDELNQP